MKDKFYKTTQNLIITGSINSGKTSLLKSLISTQKMIGIITRKKCVEKDCFVEISYNGRTYPIARKIDNKMTLLDNAFDNIALDMLKSLYNSDIQNVYIDEIGFLELEAKKYINLIIKLTQKKNCILVVRKNINPIFPRLSEIPDCAIVDLDDYIYTIK